MKRNPTSQHLQIEEIPLLPRGDTSEVYSPSAPWQQKPGKTRVIPWFKSGSKTGVSWFLNQTYQALTLCAKSLVNPGIPGRSGNPDFANNEGYRGITRL